LNRSIELGRWPKLGTLALGLGLLLASCGGGSSGSPFASSGGEQQETEEGLRAFLEAVVGAVVEADIEAMHALQDANCDSTLEEVREGFQQAQAMSMAFTGMSMGEFVDDFEFEIVEFDAELLTATVESEYGGDNELFEGPAETSEYRFIDGKWTTDDECIGAGAQIDSGDADEAIPPVDLGQSEGDLRPADEVLAERDREASDDLELGERFELDDGVVVTVLSVRLNPDYRPGESWQPTHIVDVRAENPTATDSSTPTIEIFCAGGDEGGSSYSGSTFQTYDDLPAGSFAEGELLLAVPENSDGLVVNDCEDPVVRVLASTFFSFDDEAPLTVDYPAPPFYIEAS
jgi:hypothetical protein